MKMDALKRKIEKAVGFGASFSSAQSGWKSVAVCGWQGHVNECELEPASHSMLILHLGGAVTSVNVEGRWLSRPSVPGLLTIVPGDSVVRCRVNGAVDSISVHFDPDYFDDAEGAWQSSAAYARCGFRDEFVAAAIRALADEASRGREKGQLYADTLSNAIALHIGRKYGIAEIDTNRALSPKIFNTVTQLIEESIESGISLGDLATAAGLSRAHFARLFKNSAGMSPHRYLTHRRIAHAQNLLKRPSSPLAAIAFECGFASQAHFTTCFGRITGHTPMSYRREHLDGYCSSNAADMAAMSSA